MKKNIAFGGVTRVPGGAVSSDGDLCAAVDVCNDGMGLEMIEKPELLFTLRKGKDDTVQLEFTEELLCIHEPEGEDKHYITQMFVESTATPSAQNDNEEETPSDDSEEDDNEGTTATRDGGGSESEGPGESSGDSEGESDPSEPVASDDPEVTEPVSPYTPPDLPTAAIEDVFEDWEEEYAAAEDDGGGILDAPQGSGDATTNEPGIYLCYWAWNETAQKYIRKRMIDITPFGKVTAIQTMGNTLICNHEGGENFPKEIRYWLWKAAETAYIGLGSKPPMIDITFGLESTFEYYPKTESRFKYNNLQQRIEYSRYGGVSIESMPYTDTVSVWWANTDDETQARVPPLEEYGTDDQAHWASTYSLDGVVSPDGKTDVAGMKTNWTTLALGAYNKFIAEQHKENKFVFPFYVRYAYEMYDGSLIMHSYPMLMIPNSRGPIFALDGNYGLTARLKHAGETYEKVLLRFKGRVYGFSSKLMYDLKALSEDDFARLENWKDLIRGLNIYITPPIYNYKQGGQVLGWRCMSPIDPVNNVDVAEGEEGNPFAVWDKYYTVGKVKYTDNTTNSATESMLAGNISLYSGFWTILPVHYPTAGFTTPIYWPWIGNDKVYRVPDYILEIPQKDETEVTELHENAGQFYKYAEITYSKLLGMAETAQGEKEVDARKKVLTTISNQDIMKDDNGSHDTMSADVLYAYNRRLNSANVTKILHSPLKPSVQWARDYAKTYQNSQIVDRSYPYQVTIYTKNGAEAARLKVAETGVNCLAPQFIFYPNTDAYEALISRGEGSNIRYYRVRLKEHKALNGAFWLADFMRSGTDIESYRDTDTGTPTEAALSERNKVADERNKIYTSETDNPFVVPFGNINIAGGGAVRALAAATQAMSQGQFGQYPMYTFTSEGVWAMSVNDTGGWSTIQPVTRDVIVDGTKPLSLDSTVLFLSERGLLQLAGSDIKVLSDILQGADPLILNTPNFGLHRLDDLCASTATDTEGLLNIATALALNKFPESAWMTYDYDNARIYVTPQNGNGSWVYNLKSGIWTQATTTLDNQVVSYPECEAQCKGKVMRISVDRAITDNLRSKGLVISRPIKLDDMGLLKRWRELAVRGRFKPYSTAVQVALWGTRDWIDSALVASSTRNRLTRWSGSPYFGHSVGLFLTRPSYAMQIAGMDIEVDSEHDNKLR